MEDEVLTDKSLITFGKYKGTPLANVPDEYLRWYYEQNFWHNPKGYKLKLCQYIDDNRESILK